MSSPISTQSPRCCSMGHIGDHVMMRQLRTLKNAQHLLLASPETRAQPHHIHGACPVTLYGVRGLRDGTSTQSAVFVIPAKLEMHPYHKNDESVHSIVIGDKQ